MPADHDDELHDELLRRVVAELRRPVRLDPAVDVRALRAIREGGRPIRSAPRRELWLAGTALAAGLLLAVALRLPTNAGTPTLVVASEETRQVQIRLTSPASSVAVVGDFNDWDPAATPLRLTKEGDVWVVELRLKPGRYHYTFLIDGRRWEVDPSEPKVSQSDFGVPVSVLTVS